MKVHGIALSAAVLAVLVHDADARRDRHAEAAVAAETTTVAAPQSQVTPPTQSPAPIASTFLDTLNRGREVRLGSADLVSGSVQGFTEEPIVSAAPATTAAPTTVTATSSKRASAPSTTAKTATAETWRVQCMASTQREGLTSAKQALEGKVKYPVNILYFAPYYKLMVGQFVSRTEAEKALFDVKGAGYPDAWIARTTAENAN